MEEERLQLNAKEVVPDPGQEARAGAAQLGVCETSANNRHVLIRFNPCSLDIMRSRRWMDRPWRNRSRH